MGSGKQRWKIYFQKPPSQQQREPPPPPPQPPKEFLCPISGCLMVDPVIVSSGHTFERSCINACLSLDYKPTLPDGSVTDFSTRIPNLALKAAILNWCHSTRFTPPKPLDFYSAEKLIRDNFMPSAQDPPKAAAAADFTRTTSSVSTSSEESVGAGFTRPSTPLPLTTRPSCYSSSSSADMEALNPHSIEEDEFVTKLKNNSQIFEQEEALVSLRRLTRTREETRLHLCTPRLLSAIRPLITSKYASLQVNSVAALVNLSLESQNKVKIVRSGIVPPLIDVLIGGFPESQDHASGALFSLALDDQNKTAIGVLGALAPLLHTLRSESERARHDAALALYHLSTVRSNRVKLVKLGAVPVLLGMAKSGWMRSRVLLVLCNLAASEEGRVAMLDGGAVECLVEMLERGEFDSDSTRESCVVALYGLSHGGLRFKGLAKEANAEGVLSKVEGMGMGLGKERTRDKVRRILGLLKERCEEEEAAVDWEELLNSEDDFSSGKVSSRSHSGAQCDASS